MSVEGSLSAVECTGSLSLSLFLFFFLFYPSPLLSLSLSFFYPLVSSPFFSNVSPFAFSVSLAPPHVLLCSMPCHTMLRHATASYATPRHAVSGNNIVLAGFNGGNVWPTLRAKGYANSEDAKGEQAEPLCHAVFTERLFFFLLLLLLFLFLFVVLRAACHVERLPPPIITTFAPTGADLSSTIVEGLRFDVERHAY